LHYKIHADSDHVAKFQGDRSRELGERVAKKKKEKRKKKHHEHFISPPVTTVNGRPKNVQLSEKLPRVCASASDENSDTSKSRY